MGVFPKSLVATIGGGRLELDAIAHARAMAHVPGGMEIRRFSLGPSLGQCCGGEVELRFECVNAADAPSLTPRLEDKKFPVALFGGGHVGTALAKVLSALPMDVTWIDSRDEIFPEDVPLGIRCEHSNPVHAAVKDLVPQSRILIMSFSHAEDLDIVAACLLRQRAQADLPFIGLIGSKTKWATFRHRLEAKGFTPEDLAHVTCPIGITGINDKRPEVIAVSVAAQLLKAA
jgi:xanthine dehydrogenase accessory factor